MLLLVYTSETPSGKSAAGGGIVEAVEAGGSCMVGDGSSSTSDEALDLSGESGGRGGKGAAGASRSARI
jgi:hypothetical protein